MKRSIVMLMAAMAVLFSATTAVAKEAPIGSQLAEVRAATAQYHRVDAALDAGYTSFKIDDSTVGLGLPGDPTCFDNAAGGMGVHYVKDIDATVIANEPEALVYEITDNGRLRLVAVEYIVPDSEPMPAPLFGQHFHHHGYLPVYILHAWVWKNNPSGMFADFNPKVGDCPG
jgi:hypothetical protein